jgi:hypothetical protein
LRTLRAPIARAIVFGTQLAEYAWKVPTTGAPASNVHASQPTYGAIGSCTWITSKLPARSSARRRTALCGVTASLDCAPFIGSEAVRPSGTT